MTINITKLKINPIGGALSPGLIFDISFKYHGNNCNLFSAEGKFLIKDNAGEFYAARLHSNLPDVIGISDNSDASIIFDSTLSFSDLNRIEEIRKGQKLNLKVMIGINCLEGNQVKRYLTEYQEVIEKSAWVEDILSSIGYGKTDYIALRFSELYKDERIERESEHFHKAIESYNRGDYDHVLVECRKVIQGIESQEKNLQISKKAGNENYKRALAVGNNYLSLGAHSETEIKARVLRHDSEFALLTTLGLLRFVTMTLKEDSQ